MSQFATMPDEELRRLAALSDGLLTLESLRQVGLVAGGPPIVTERCRETVAYALLERGLNWSADEAQNAVMQFIAEWNEHSEASAA